MTNSQLFCQYKPLTKEQLNLKFHYALGNGDNLADFYESILPNDTVFCLEISYEGYENYLLNCIDSPVFKYVQELQINGCYNDIPVAITKLQNLTGLYIDSHCDLWCGTECSMYIPNEIYRLPNLEILNISTNNVSISDSIINLKKLKHLNISSVSLLPILFTDMPQLKSIGLNDVYTSNKELHKIILNKLLVFSHYPKASYSFTYNEFGINYDSIEAKLKPFKPLNIKVDFKIKNQYDKNETLFEIKGEIKNNKAEGEWIVKSVYNLKANFINGIKQNSIISLNDTTIISKVTKENDGIETEINYVWERKSKKNIPTGDWKYGSYLGNCDYKISFDSPQIINFKNADTLSFFSWKSFKNGIEDGVWKQYRGGFDKKIIKFENGKIKRLEVYEYHYYRTIPIVVKDYNYQDIDKLTITTYSKGDSLKLFKYTEECYNAYTPNGAFITYFENGNIQKIEVFENGKIRGNQIEYNQDKKIKRISMYENGYLVHEIYYHDNEQKEYEVYFNINGIYGNENRWNEFGQLIETKFYKNGKPEGVSRKFDKNGNVTFENYYENGIEIYNEERGFDDVFIFNDYIMKKFDVKEIQKTCCRHEYCKISKKVINDSISQITEYEYSESTEKRLIYKKLFNFKNYKLNGLQTMKDSFGNIIESVVCINGKLNGNLTVRNEWGNYLTMRYKNDKIVDTILTYDFWKAQKRVEYIYQYKELKKTITYNPKIKSTKEICYYEKHKKKTDCCGYYFIPRKILWISPTDSVIKTMNFKGRIKEDVYNSNINDANGYAFVNGKLTLFNKNTLYRNIFIENCKFDLFKE